MIVLFCIPREQFYFQHVIVNLWERKMKKTKTFLLTFRIKMHEDKLNKKRKTDEVPEGAVPAYLLDREGQSRAKVLSNMVKQKRKEKAGKWDVPIPKTRGVSEHEVFKVLKTGKRKGKEIRDSDIY